jgi:hypothetical protein
MAGAATVPACHHGWQGAKMRFSAKPNRLLRDLNTQRECFVFGRMIE